MESFFSPHSIVLFGASSNEQKSGNHVLRNILNYTKENVYLIHPKEDDIYGIKCYKSIFEIPVKNIDLGIIVLPVGLVLETINSCIKFGIKSIIVESATLYLKANDKDNQNLEKIREIKELLKQKKVRIMGPNSIGVYCANQDKNSFITSLIYFKRLPKLKKKNLSIIAQTGLTLSGLLLHQNYIQELGIAKIASIGNKFDINETDILDYLENDSQTDVIALYLEDIKEGKRFLSQCKRIVKKKPIIMLKSGKTEKGRKAIASHTQSLAGDYKMVEALSRQVGIINVNDFSEMFNVAKVLLNQPRPKGRNLGVISISGAGTVLASDLASEFGFDLPSLKTEQIKNLRKIFPKFAWDDIYNPLDIWAAVEKVGPQQAYEKAGKILLEQNEYDYLVYYLTAIEETEFNWQVLTKFNAKYPETAIIMGFFGGDRKLILKWREILEENLNIPTFQSISEMFKILSKISLLK
jgi:acetyltransferase